MHLKPYENSWRKQSMPDCVSKTPTAVWVSGSHSAAQRESWDCGAAGRPVLQAARKLGCWPWPFSGDQGLPCPPHPAFLCWEQRGGTCPSCCWWPRHPGLRQAQSFVFLYSSTFSSIQMYCLNEPDIQKKPHSFPLVFKIKSSLIKLKH